jgi:RNA polymerase sigma factor (sigma-70 family)
VHPARGVALGVLRLAEPRGVPRLEQPDRPGPSGSASRGIGIGEGRRRPRENAYVLTCVREVAEDLVQEAFLRAFDRLDTLREPDAFPGYLRQTVLNLARAHLRRQRVERLSLRWHALLVGSPHGVPADIKQREGLWLALQRLPYRQRAALVLRYYEDLSRARPPKRTRRPP